MNCPNCGQQIDEKDAICPKCGFDIQEFREKFSLDEDVSRKDFEQTSTNPVVEKMIKWFKENPIIVFMTGLALLVVTSLSVPAGWLLFFALMIWLYIACSKNAQVKQYDVDKNMTVLLSNLGSEAVNKANAEKEEVLQKEHTYLQKHPKYEQKLEKSKSKRGKLGHLGLSLLIVEVFYLIVFFSDASLTAAGNGLSISAILLIVARTLSTFGARQWGLLLYLLWLVQIIWPILIIHQTIKSTKSSKLIAFVLCLLESAFFIYMSVHLSSIQAASTGFLRVITTQLKQYMIGIGISSYLITFLSILATGLSLFNLFGHKKRS